MKKILAYLNGTIHYGIVYRSGGSDSGLIGFSDADFAGDLKTRRSTTGYVFYLSNGPVTWSSQRQKLVTLSTTESEYVAAEATSREVLWLRGLLKSINCECNGAIKLYIDNQSAIKLVKNTEFYKRTKHIDIRYHSIREKVKKKTFKYSEYIPSEACRYFYKSVAERAF